MKKMTYTIGFDLGGTKLAAALLDNNGEMIDFIKVPVDMKREKSAAQTQKRVISLMADIALDFKNRFPGEVRSWTQGKECYVILAMDAETFGHHEKYLNIKLLSDFLAPLLETFGGNEREGIKIEPLGNIFRAFPKVSGCVPPGSWATTVDDFRAGDYFPLWSSPRNQLHKIMWEISNLAVSCLDKNLRHDLEIFKCQTSCQFWWVAGGRRRLDLALKDVSHALIKICERSVGDPEKEQAVRRLHKELLDLIGD